VTCLRKTDLARQTHWPFPVALTPAWLFRTSLIGQRTLSPKRRQYKRAAPASGFWRKVHTHLRFELVFHSKVRCPVRIDARITSAPPGRATVGASRRSEVIFTSALRWYSQKPGSLSPGGLASKGSGVRFNDRMPAFHDVMIIASYAQCSAPNRRRHWSTIKSTAHSME
jgi:hypothetical protein